MTNHPSSTHPASAPPPFAWGDSDSPLGRLYVAATAAGVCAVAYGLPEAVTFVREVDADQGADGIYDPTAPWVAQALAELAEYFAGTRQEFTVPVDLTAVRGPFARRALAELQRVPYGHLVSYGELARRVGQPRAARAAGAACRVCPVPILVPCHRVVHAAGDLGGWGGPLWHKRALLEIEGVSFAPGSVAWRSASPRRPAARRGPAAPS